MPSTGSKMISLLFLITPIFGHRLITGDVQNNNAYDSIIVSSDPIRITNNKYNEKNGTTSTTTTTRKPDYAIRFNRNTLTNDNDLESTNSEERSFKDCKHNDIKCLYDNNMPDKTENTNKNQDIINKFLEQYSSITNVKFNYDEFENSTKEENQEDNDSSSDLKKSYWSLVNAEKHNHPYDDKKGWVTLEPVPWSTSKVSKWQSNVQPSNPSPSSSSSNYYHQPSQSYYPSQSHYPSQQHDGRPWNYGPTQTPTAHVWVMNRPSQDRPHHHETESHGQYVKPTNPFSNYRPASQWGIGSNDIITDNRPSDFPQGSNSYASYQKPNYQFGNHYSGPPKYTEQYYNQGYQGNRPTRYPTTTGHPSTYPDKGNGEWILLSTTKGYSLPQRPYRDSPKIVNIDTKMNDLSNDPMITSRNMKLQDISRYHEENIDDKYVLVSRNADVNRKSGEDVNEGSKPQDHMMEIIKPIEEENKKPNNTWNMDGLRTLYTDNGVSILAAAKETARNGKDNWNMDENPIQVLQTKAKVEGLSSPSMTYKRTVRLTVLPSLGNTSTTAHNGLLEVDASYHSVDEAQQEEEKLKKLSEIANVKKSNFGRVKLVPMPVQATNTGKAMNSKSAAILAAVGAGMIPATMAVLVPMALGRKKRDVTSSQPVHIPSLDELPWQLRNRHSASW